MNDPEVQRSVLHSQDGLEDPEAMEPDVAFCASLEYGLAPTCRVGLWARQAGHGPLQPGQRQHQRDHRVPIAEGVEYRNQKNNISEEKNSGKLRFE